jgi:hypothetical protein
MMLQKRRYHDKAQMKKTTKAREELAVESQTPALPKFSIA